VKYAKVQHSSSSSATDDGVLVGDSCMGSVDS